MYRIGKTEEIRFMPENECASSTRSSMWEVEAIWSEFHGFGLYHCCGYLHSFTDIRFL